MAHGDDGWEAPAGFNFTRDVVEHFATDPRRPALTFVDADGVIERQTFGQVAANAARWAHVMRGSGHQPGDRVLVLLGNVPEATAVLLGAIKGGLVTVPCPAPMPAHEIAFRAQHSGASLLIADRSAEAEIDAVRGLLDAEIKVLFLDEAQALLNRCRSVAPTEITSPDRYPFVLYTSGVTKEPKGVAHTHAATYAARLQAKHWLEAGPGDIVWCTAANWWHPIWNVLGAWSLGAEVVMHVGAFDPGERLELVEFLGVSILGQTPKEYDLMAALDLSGAARPLRLRHAVSAGEPLSLEVTSRFHDAFGIPVCDGYGQAENALLVAGAPSRPSQPGSMGFSVPGHHVAVIDDDGREMPLGEEGEIALQGRPPTLFDHYWGAPEETDAAVRDSWYLTGDRATRDEDGSFWFMGRADDMIVSGAHRVGAFEVEWALLDHPAIAESAVVGKPDSDQGEIVKAFVVLREGVQPTDELADELRAHAKLDPMTYAYPREIEFVTELPRTANGKIRRIDLRELEHARAGVEASPPDEGTHSQGEDARRAEAAHRRTAERERRAAAKAAKQAEEARARAAADERRQAERAQRQAEKDARRAEKEAKRAEAARLRAEANERASLEEAQRRAEKEAAQAEAARLRSESDERRRQEKEQRETQKQAERADAQARKADEARARAETEERHRQEEAERRAEQEAKQAEASRLQAEAKEQARLEEAQRRAEQEAQKSEGPRLRAEAKERARLEEARRRAEQEARKAEESRLRAEAKERARLEEAQRRAEEEARKAETERQRAEEEQHRRSAREERDAETERLRLEHERLRADVEAVRKAEAEERRQAAEEAKRSTKAEDGSRRDEAKRAEQEAARRANGEAERRREVEAARRKLEKAERQRRRSKPRPPERPTTRSQPEEEETELGAMLVERLQAYGHGGAPGDDA